MPPDVPEDTSESDSGSLARRRGSVRAAGIGVATRGLAFSSSTWRAGRPPSAPARPRARRLKRT